MNKKKIAALATGLALGALAVFGSTGAHAQIGDYPPTTGTVGAPNTGAGGEAALNIALLLVSGSVAIGGAAYLLRSKKPA